MAVLFREMNPSLSAYIAIPVAAITLLGAGLAWYIFVRPVPRRSAEGVITKKTFVPARDLSGWLAGGRRESFTRRSVPIPDGYRFEIQVGGSSQLMTFWLEATAAKHFIVGEAVHVVYEERGLRPFWKRVYVRQMTRLGN